MTISIFVLPKILPSSPTLPIFAILETFSAQILGEKKRSSLFHKRDVKREREPAWMKKLIVALVLSFALIGCSGGGGGDATSTPAMDKTPVATPADGSPDTAATPMETPAATETPSEG